MKRSLIVSATTCLLWPATTWAQPAPTAAPATPAAPTAPTTPTSPTTAPAPAQGVSTPPEAGTAGAAQGTTQTTEQPTAATPAPDQAVTPVSESAVTPEPQAEATSIQEASSKDKSSSDEGAAVAAEEPTENAPPVPKEPLPYALQAPINYNLPNSSPRIDNYFWPILGTLGINTTMWGFSKITGAEFADVGPEYWEQNFVTGFQWDDNEFEVNQVGHPYQGGLYYTTARVNGLTFWQSMPYLMFGSLQWEYFMETESPSTNDFLTTTWGGAFFGEVLFRLSNSVLDDSASGANRFWREFAGLAISPINGLDRLFTGKAWKDGPRNIKVPVRGNFRLGVDGIGLSEGTGWQETMGARVRLDYGDPYANKKVALPFDVFDFALGMSFGEDTFTQSFDGTGVLMGQRVRGDEQAHLLAWIWDFEYFTNGTTKLFTRESDGIYQLGEMGTGFGWYGHFDLGNRYSIDTRADAIYVPTGSMTSPWAKYESNRSYNYSMGAATKLEFNLRHERVGRLYARANRYFYSVVDGAMGEELLGMLELGTYFNIYNGHGIGANAQRYDRNSYYRDYPDVSDFFWSGQMYYELEY